MQLSVFHYNPIKRGYQLSESVHPLVSTLRGCKVCTCATWMPFNLDYCVTLITWKKTNEFKIFCLPEKKIELQILAKRKMRDDDMLSEVI
jgi:hypothetical protein